MSLSPLSYAAYSALPLPLHRKEADKGAADDDKSDDAGNEETDEADEENAEPDEADDAEAEAEAASRACACVCACSRARSVMARTTQPRTAASKSASE